MFLRVKLILLMVMTLSYNLLFSQQETSSKGTEFWLGFMDHANTTQADLDLYITSDSATTGTVYIDGASWSDTFTVIANQVTIVNVPSILAHVGCSDCIQNKGIRIVTAKPVAVFAHIHRNYRSDATLVLPIEATGKEYRVMTWNQEPSGDHSQFMIVATSDSTKINITPQDLVNKSGGGTYPANVKYSITLNKGQVYQGQAPGKNNDLTGTLIEVIDTGTRASCKKVAVFSGNSVTSLGCTSASGSVDNLYEQLFPVSSWATDYLVVPFLTRSNDRIRVVAHSDNTVVLLNGSFAANLSQGQFYQSGPINSPQVIKTTKPASVAQFQSTQSCGSNSGDPSMVMISPVQQTLKDIVVYSSEFEAITKNFINVTMRTSDTSTFTIDGKKVTFTPFASSSYYSYAQITVSKGFQHMKSGGEGFVAIAYGTGNFESYAYSAGANVTNLAAYIDLGNNAVKTNVVNTLCKGEIADFKGNANYKVKKWEWFFGDDSSSTLQNVKHTYKDTGTYKVKMLVTKESSAGCSSVDSAFMKVVVVNNPKVNFGFDNACDGKEISFYDTVTTDPPGIIELKLWDFGNGNRAFGDNPKHLYDTAGKYKVDLLVRNSYECSITYSDSIEVYPNPEAKFTVVNSCFKDSAIMQDSSIAMPYPVRKWIWNMGEGSIDTVYKSRHTFLYDTFGTFTINLQVETSKGCTASADSTLVKHPIFIAAFSMKDSCLKETFVLNDTSQTGGIAPISRLWTLGDGTTSSAKSIAHKYSAAATYNVKLVIKQNNQCADSIEKILNVYRQVSPSFTVQNLCFKDSSILTALHLPSNQVISSYNWQYGVLTGNSKVFKTQFTDTGKQNFKLITITDKGCRDTLDSFVRINPKPIADFKTNSFLCETGNATFINTSKDFNKGFTKIDWKSSVSTSINNPDTFRYTLGSALYETVELIVASNDGCADTTSKTIKVWRKPKITIAIADLCPSESITATNASTVDSSSISTWSWILSDGKTSADSIPIATYALYGNKKAILTATSNKGCIGKDSTSFTVNPKPVVNYTVTEACLGLPTQFNNASTVTSGGISSTNYYFGDGTTSSLSSPAHTYLASGIYNSKLVVITDNLCSDSLSVAVKAHAIPSTDFVGNPIAGCLPLIVDFGDNSIVSGDNIAQWEWVVNSTIFSTKQNTSYTFTSPGTKSVLLRVKSSFGCEHVLEKVDYIEVYPKPIASFSYLPKKPTIIDSEITATDLSTGAVLWSWTFGDGGTSADQNPKHNYKDTGNYRIRLEITNNNNCTDDTSVYIFVEPGFSVDIPNSFSPNGDGLNDFWGPVGILQGVKGYELLIINRWGEILFQTNDVNATWDGTYMGEPVQEGFYHYRMRYTDYFITKWHVQNNSLYLMR